MLSFLTSKIFKISALVGLGVALIVIPYCAGKRVGYQNCMDKGYKDAIKREDEYNRIREKRDEDYKKIVDDLPSANDKRKSDLLSRRPYKH